MNDIQKTCKRIREWFAEFAPSRGLELPPPASNADIKRLESHLGFAIPDSLKESYLTHNGSNEFGVFAYGSYMLSISEVIRESTNWRDAVKAGVFDDIEPINRRAKIKPVWWNSQWIPITSSGGGDHNCVDMDPTKKGTIGQIIDFSHEEGPQRVVAKDFASWLSIFAASLEAGKLRYDEDSWTLLPI